MTAGRDALLGDAREGIGRAIAAATSVDLADKAFAAWLLGRAECPFEVDGLIAAGVQNHAPGYRDVAALGLLAALTDPLCDFRGELIDGLTWLSSRPTTICGTPAGFLSDPVALLGVAVGVSQCGKRPVEAAVGAWFDGVLAARASLPKFETWEECLLAGAAHLLGRPTAVPLPSSSDVADCRVTLRRRMALRATHPADAARDEASVVALVVNGPGPQTAFARQVLLAAAYDALRNQIIEEGTVPPPSSQGSEMAGDSDTKRKKVFVSYAWESDNPGHQNAVFQFTNKLRNGYGLEATMDLMEPNPPDGLPAWMRRKIRESDFVLMVITETYRRRFDGEEKPGSGKGVKWEGGLITRHVYKLEFQNDKFLPILFGKKHASSMPDIFEGNTFYDVTDPEGLESLVRYITDQPAWPAAPLGEVPILPPRKLS